MCQLIHINEAVVVEGKYDKIKLASIIDAAIITINGFSIFKDRALLALIRRLAETRGVVILTDSDAAGFKIRGFLRGAIPKGRVVHVYIPDLYGKEPRKQAPSKEGKLGVEGIPREVLIESLKRAGVIFHETRVSSRHIAKADLYEDGLAGSAGSRALRLKLIRSLGLPERLSSNALLDVLNAVMSFDEYKAAIQKLKLEE